MDRHLLIPSGHDLGCSEQQMESEFYLQARREWDERYGDVVLGKRDWQIAVAGLMLLTLILALGIVWMGARTKVIPYVVEVDKLGYAITIPTALTASSTATSVERMKRYEIAAFIRNARSVCSDRNFEICLQRLARTLRDAT
jgi:type IV secretory pathway TrbF-like protein